MKQWEFAETMLLRMKWTHIKVLECLRKINKLYFLLIPPKALVGGDRSIEVKNHYQNLENSPQTVLSVRDSTS